MLITDRVRSTRGGNIFSLSVCPHPGGGVPTFRMVGGGYLLRSGWWGGYLPRSGQGGYLLSGLDRGGGVPTFPGLDGGGYLPSQVVGGRGYLGRYPPQESRYPPHLG